MLQMVGFQSYTNDLTEKNKLLNGILYKYEKLNVVDVIPCSSSPIGFGCALRVHLYCTYTYNMIKVRFVMALTELQKQNHFF